MQRVCLLNDIVGFDVLASLRMQDALRVTFPVVSLRSTTG